MSGRRGLWRRRRPVEAAALFILNVSLLSCSAGEASRSVDGTVDTLSSGLVEVRNRDRGLWSTAAAWRVEEDLRLGGTDSGPQSFSIIRALTVDESGTVYVADGQAKDVRKFTPNGEYVGTVGRLGDGPGEFRSPIGLGVRSGTLLVVEDSRFIFFDTAGAYRMAVRRFPFRSGGRWQGTVLADGRVADVVYRRDGERLRTGFVVVDSIGVSSDTFFLPMMEQDAYLLEHTVGGETARLSLPVPFAPRSHWRVHADGYIWTGYSDRFHLAQLSLTTADTVRTLDKPFRRVRVRASEADSALTPLKQTLPGASFDRSRIPRSKPPFNDLHVDAEGHVWVQRPGTGREQGVWMDVFDAVGRFLGSLRIADQVEQPVVITSSHLYAVVTNASGLPQIVRYRIVKP